MHANPEPTLHPLRMMLNDIGHPREEIVHHGIRWHFCMMFVCCLIGDSFIPTLLRISRFVQSPLV